MQHDDNRCPGFTASLSQKAKQSGLIAQVKVCGRLIQKQATRPLSKATGNCRPLLFTTGERVKGAMGKWLKIKNRHHLGSSIFGDGLISPTRHRQRHQFRNRERKRHGRLLGNIGNQPCRLSGRHVVQVTAPKHDAAFGRPERSGQTAKQRRFPGAVRTNECCYPTGFDSQTEARQHNPLPIANCYVFRFKQNAISIFRFHPHVSRETVIKYIGEWRYNLSMSLRVASYNIHGGTDVDRKPSLGRIIASLKTINADIVLVQEIDRLLPRSAFQDQFALIADGLNLSYRAFYGRLCFGPCAFGNAIMTRLPVTHWQRIPLPSRGGEPRAALGANLEQGTSIWCTHLGLRKDWRESHLMSLAAAINASTHGPAILGGDFNALRSDSEMEAFRTQTGLDDFGEEAPTVPVVGPYRRIDHLLARGFTRVNAGTPEDHGSDHRLIWADFAELPLPASEH